jgi:hypothetical protein
VNYYISKENKCIRREINTVSLGHIGKSVFGIVETFLWADATLKRLYKLSAEKLQLRP